MKDDVTDWTLVIRCLLISAVISVLSTVNHKNTTPFHTCLHTCVFPIGQDRTGQDRTGSDRTGPDDPCHTVLCLYCCLYPKVQYCKHCFIKKTLPHCLPGGSHCYCSIPDCCNYCGQLWQIRILTESLFSQNTLIRLLIMESNLSLANTSYKSD